MRNQKRETIMGGYLDQVPARIHDHIREITKTSGMPDTDESVEEIARAWLEKKEIFEASTSDMKMEEALELAADDDRGALMLTYSGSLVTLGPLVDGTRRAEYASIGLRQDVPDSAENDEAVLAGDVAIDGPVAFTEGPFKKSSPIFRIAILPAGEDPEEDQEQLSSATQIITERFVEVNRTLVAE
ncbi:MAG: hypothetical protein ACOC1I_05720 [Spirochaetota bacterium]